MKKFTKIVYAQLNIMRLDDSPETRKVCTKRIRRAAVTELGVRDDAEIAGIVWRIVWPG